MDAPLYIILGIISVQIGMVGLVLSRILAQLKCINVNTMSLSMIAEEKRSREINAPSQFKD